MPLDIWAHDFGYLAANHYIVTKYVDGAHCISWHYDKPKSIARGSLITVVKTGAHGRPFQLRHRVKLDRLADEGAKDFKKRHDVAQAREPPFFDQAVSLVTPIIMTLGANLLTQHAVPAVAEAGSSGSIGFRTITERVFDMARPTPKRRRMD